MKNSTSSTFTIVFHLRKLAENEDKKLPVYARITINGKRIELSSKQMTVLFLERGNNQPCLL